MLLSITMHTNFFIGLFSDQFIRFKKMARLSCFLYRLAFSPGSARLNQFTANTFGKNPPLARQWQCEYRHAREKRDEADGGANYCTFLGPVPRLLFSPNQSARDDRERTGGRASNEKQIKFGGHVNAITRTRRGPGKNINRTCNPA